VAGRVDLDAAALKQAVDYASAHNSYSVRVYRHNCLAAKSTLDQLTENVPNNVWSTTKGVISMLVGRAEKLGKLSLDDPIGKYLPQGRRGARGDHDPPAAHAELGAALRLDARARRHPDDEVQYTLDLPFDYRAAPTSSTARPRSRCSRAWCRRRSARTSRTSRTSSCSRRSASSATGSGCATARQHTKGWAISTWRRPISPGSAT
jgi:hypothetical protein